VLAKELGDEGLAHGHSPPGGEAPIEAVRDASAAGLRHERLQADDLPSDPDTLGSAADEMRCGARGEPTVAERTPPQA